MKVCNGLLQGGAMKRLFLFILVLLFLSTASHASVLQNAPSPVAGFSVNAYPHNGIANAHPSVIDFQTQYGLSQWPQTGQGWRFWGGITTVWPEDPYLFVSNDGINWQSLNRVDYNSAAWDDIDENFLPHSAGGSGEDIDLEYDPDSDVIRCYWIRYAGEPFADYTSSSHAQGVMTKAVNPDLSFGPPQQVGPAVSNLSNPSNSPGVVRQATGQWHMWGVFYKSGVANGVDNKGRITYRSSNDGIAWSSYRFVDDTLFHSVFPDDTVNHLSAFPDPYDTDRVFLLVQVCPTATIDGPSGILMNGRLVLLATTFDNPTVISEVPLSDYILESSVPDSSLSNNHGEYWDAGGIYRSDAQVRVEGEDLVMDLWYNGIQSVYGVTYDFGLGGAGARGPGAWVGFTSGSILPLHGVENDRPAGEYPEGTLATLTDMREWVDPPADIYYCWDGGTWQTYSAPIPLQTGTLEWYGETPQEMPKDIRIAAYTISTSVNAPPVADAGPDQALTDTNGDGYEDVVLDGTSSTDDGTIVSYEWRQYGALFGSGSSLHVSQPVGSYTFTLTVTDDSGQTDTDEVQVTVTSPAVNQLPVANAGPDQTLTDTDGDGYEDVVLDGSASTDDGTIVSCQWHEGGMLIGSGSTPLVTLPAGDHSIALTVTDDGGLSATDQVLISINSPPSIVPIPVTHTYIGSLFSYDVDTTGYPAPTFTLVSGPPGMTIDPGSGLIEWTPNSEGSFNVEIEAVNTSGTDTLSFTIVVSPIVVLTSPANGASFTAPAQITLTADASPTTTRVDFYEGENLLWSDTTAPFSFDWNDVTAGNYTLAAKGYDGLGGEVVSALAMVTVAPPVSGVNLSVDPVGPQTKGNVIHLLASASGGSGNYEYKFRTYKDGAYADLRDYSPTSTVDWTPTAAGTYYLIAYARNQGSSATFEAQRWVRYNITDVAPVASVALSTDKGSPQLKGATIQLLASAGGGNGNYEYKFTTYKDGAYADLRGYSATSTVDWTPTAAGTYYLIAYARNQGSSATFEAQRWVRYNITDVAPVASVALSTDKESPHLQGATIQISASASGGNGNYEYKFRTYKDGAYADLRGYSPTRTVDWTPTDAGSYYLIAYARNQGSSATFEAQRWVRYNITDVAPVASVALSTDEESPQLQGTTIQLSASANGGSGNYEYKFRTYKDGAYADLRDYSPTSTVDWTPTAAGTYYLIASARNQGSSATVEAQRWILFQVLNK